MFNNIISWSLHNKAAVLLGAGLVTMLGLYSIATMKVDILPDINKPSVTVFAESPGMAAEEVERSILTPIESVLSGTPGVERLTGNASYAQATINIEFAWDTDRLRNRQVVQERLAQAILPANVKPTLGPATSLLGEIMWIGIAAKNAEVAPMQLRTLADWTIRPALLKVPGVANVLVMGGDVREWQININAERLKRYGLMFDDIRDNVQAMLVNRSGGIITEDAREYAIRILTAPASPDDLAGIAIGKDMMTGRVIRLGDIAAIAEAPSPLRGSGAIDGKPGVVLRVIRQPEAETLKVTDAIEASFAALRPSLPEGVVLYPSLFRQEGFIRAGLGNVEDALRDGTIFVIIILIIFLMNVRMTLITLTAIPLSILATAIVFHYFGLSVNVMTLGGIAVAVGELVDDAIVDVENIYHRLRDWMRGNTKETREAVVLKASKEVRNSIVYATVLVAVVFLPIFTLPGIEGKLIIALGTAYLVSLFASMAVSLTVTPVLSALLLNDRSLKNHQEETAVVRKIKAFMTPWIHWCIGNVRVLSYVTGALLVVTVGMYLLAGKEGIPPFNEGSFVAMVFLPPGTALAETNEYVARLSKEILKVEGVRQVTNIAGRASADPHGGSTNTSEVQIALKPGLEEERDHIFKGIQTVLNRVGGADFSLGQPITHRVEMLISGVRAPVVVKVFGDNPAEMEKAGTQIVAALKKQKGISNARIQQNALVPELRLYVDTNRLAEAGVSSGKAADDLEMGLMGDRLGQVRLGPASVNVVAYFDAESKNSMAALRDLAVPFMGIESMSDVGDVRLEDGRTSIDHEAGKRVLIVSANYQGKDVVGAVDAAKREIESKRLPDSITLSFEGNYKSQKESAERLMISFVLAILLIFGVLYHAFKSVKITLLIMTNIPTVLVGGMIGIWLTGGSVNLAHMVGFISLAGIVSRNGIMLIGRSLSLVQHEGKVFTPETVVAATLDRVVPVLMTSLVTGLALIPLMMGGGEPGKEMLTPLAVVIFGGLISSTIISLFLTPALFYRFGREAAECPSDGSVSGF